MDYSQGLPTLSGSAVDTPGEAIGYYIGGAISGGIVAFSIGSRKGWEQGLTVGLLVFFASAAIKMTYDVWRHP